jgi:hypothetical protein
LSTVGAIKINIKMEKIKSTEVAVAASAVVGTVAAVQMLTDWDPLGRCFTFVKQLRGHVSLNWY